MATSDLMPLPRNDIQVGQTIRFPIFDAEGHLLLAAGQVVSSEKQLEDLSEKGLFFNPKWAENLVSSRMAAGSVKPASSIYKPQRTGGSEDPAESGRILRMSVPGDDQHCLVKLIGEIGRDAFLVSHPTRDDSYMFVKEGQTWEFRAFYGTSVYRFEAMVEKVLLKPYPLVICSWPIETTKESRLIRSAKRVSCHLATTIKPVAENSGPINGALTNLSTGGVEVRTSANNGKNLSKGLEVELDFQLHLADRKFLLTTYATVMSRNEEEDEIKLGCAFTNLSDAHFGLIHGFVMDQSVHRIESALYTYNAKP